MKISSLFLILVVPVFGKRKDEVDLQWSLCESHPEVVMQKLGKGGKSPFKEFPVTYYDTLLPKYTENGVMFRTKVTKGKPISVVKVRLAQGTTATPDGSRCVWDQYGNETFYTCQLSSLLDPAAPWTDEQKSFVEEYERVAWNDLAPFGPYQNPKWKFKIKGHKAVFDDVKALPHHLMEIEVSVPRRKAKDAYRKITKHLERHGVKLCKRQEARTLRLFRALGLPVHGDGMHTESTGLEDLPQLGPSIEQSPQFRIGLRA